MPFSGDAASCWYGFLATQSRYFAKKVLTLQSISGFPRAFYALSGARFLTETDK